MTKAPRYLFLAGLLSLAAGTVAVVAKEQPATRPATQPATPANKFCPIEPEHEIDSTVTVTHKGKVVGFCCADCIKDFKKDPDKYVKNMK